MPKQLTFRKGLLSVLLWSVISAAFIGPGTVTTSSNAGAVFGLNLLWALTFSIIATMVLQEAAARITIASGKSLGEIIALQYARGRRSRQLKLVLFLAVAFGCAAYQAGNLLGALAGLALFSDFSQRLATLGLGVVCAALLWIGSVRIITNLLGLIVAFMGFTFLYVAIRTDVGMADIGTAVFRVGIPRGGLLLAIGLIGTTIVPYNLFLASGISTDQSILEMRWGVGMAVLIGGIITVAIMVVGTQVEGAFSFGTLADAVAVSLGNWATAFFGLGLFAAGLSSSVTAPLAAAITARSLFGASRPEWRLTSFNFRLVWGLVLVIGLLFGILKVRPVPAIILAQALNGILLPVVAIFLLMAVNDRKLIPPAYLNSIWSNLITLLIVVVSCFLGINNLWKALTRLVPAWEGWSGSILLHAGLSIGIGVVVGIYVFRKEPAVKNGAD